MSASATPARTRASPARGRCWPSSSSRTTAARPARRRRRRATSSIPQRPRDPPPRAQRRRGAAAPAAREPARRGLPPPRRQPDLGRRRAVAATRRQARPDRRRRAPVRCGDALDDAHARAPAARTAALERASAPRARGSRCSSPSGTWCAPIRAAVGYWEPREAELLDDLRALDEQATALRAAASQDGAGDGLAALRAWLLEIEAPASTCAADACAAAAPLEPRRREPLADAAEPARTRRAAGRCSGAARRAALEPLGHAEAPTASQTRLHGSSRAGVLARPRAAAAGGRSGGGADEDRPARRAGDRQELAARRALRRARQPPRRRHADHPHRRRRRVPLARPAGARPAPRACGAPRSTARRAC